MAPLFVQLFGPVQDEGSLYAAVGPQWGWPPSALSANTKTFHFQHGLGWARSAVFKVIWTTPNTDTYIRLLSMDDGPSNLSGIFQIQGTGRGEPDNQGADFTAYYNQLVANRQYKHLGFQLWDDGTNPARIYEVRLEIV